MTPSLSGRMAWMFDGVRPIIRLASDPTASGRPSFMSTATTEGSLRTIPRPRTYTNVFAVPRSTAMSRPSRERRFSAMSGSPRRMAAGAGGGPGARWCGHRLRDDANLHKADAREVHPELGFFRTPDAGADAALRK